MELIISPIHKIFTSSTGEPTFRLEMPELKFKYGTVSYILGHNGSGKSLFLKILNGDTLPTKGNIRIYDQGKSLISSEVSISLVRQKIEENLCLDLSVEENLILKLPINGLKEKLFPKKLLRQRITDSLDNHTELLKKTTQICSELSGGQRQFLAFVIATVQQSRVLCLDEFLSSTDHATSLILREKAKEYAKNNNACVLIVSHDFEVALEDADEIYVFHDGKLLSQLQRNSANWNKDYLKKITNSSYS